MVKRKRKAAWGKRAKDYGDDPKKKKRDRLTRSKQEYWERTHVKAHSRRKPGGTKKTVRVKAYTRTPG